MELTPITKKIINQINNTVQYHKYLNFHSEIQTGFFIAAIISLYASIYLAGIFFWLFCVVKLLGYQYGKLTNWELNVVSDVTLRKKIINKVRNIQSPTLNESEIVELQYKRTAVILWLIPVVLLIKYFA